MPRAFRTAVSAAPARSKARASLYTIPLARASKCARAKCIATNEEAALAAKAIAVADIDAKIRIGRECCHAAKGRRDEGAALDSQPHSTCSGGCHVDSGVRNTQELDPRALMPRPGRRHAQATRRDSRPGHDRVALFPRYLDAGAQPGHKSRFSSGHCGVDSHDLLGLDDDLFTGANFGRRKLHRVVAADGAYADVQSSLDVSSLDVHAKASAGHESLDDKGRGAREAREDGDGNGMWITGHSRPTSRDDGTGGGRQPDEWVRIRRIALGARDPSHDGGSRHEGERNAREVGDFPEQFHGRHEDA